MIRRTSALAAWLLAATLLAPAVIPAQTTDTPLTPRTFIEVAKKVLPSVVSITVDVEPDQRLLDQNGAADMEEMLRNWMQDPQSMPAPEFFRQFSPEDFGYSGAGSGVIVHEKDGWAYVVTNAHVLEKGDRVRYTVTLDTSPGQDDPVEAKGEDVEIIGSDNLTDVAVMRFRVPKGVNVHVAEFADSNALEVGEWVLALGNPLELNNSVSQGIVSAKHRVIQKSPIEDLVQTTATINPGNSGGPLVNLDGRIVGINNAIATSTGRWAGVGFAIPGNEVRRISDMLIRDGRLTRGYLGIQMDDLTSSLADAFDLGETRGVLVRDVRPDTPAESAGMEIGDIIVAIEGRKVRDASDLLRYVGGRNAGETLKVEVIRFRENKRSDMAFDITLMERPDEQQLASEMAGDQETQEARARLEDFGLKAEPQREGPQSGMLVTEVLPESPAARAGLRVGDALVQVNGVDTKSVATLLEGLDNVREGKDHVILFRRNGSNQFLTMDSIEK